MGVLRARNSLPNPFIIKWFLQCFEIIYNSMALVHTIEFHNSILYSPI